MKTVKLARCPNGKRRSKKSGKCEKTEKRISFLFLTYSDLTHTDVMKEYVKSHDVFVHPKHEMKDSFFKSKVIPETIPTTWATISIVHATILLLKRAILNPKTKWFVLLSQDVYPMRPIKEFEQFLSHQTSSLMDFKWVSNGIWKTSQWWILTRTDVTTIVTHYEEFISANLIPKTAMGALDELFFLTLLKWKDPHYVYTPFTNVYTRWLEYTVAKSPMCFNKLLSSDIRDIQETNAFFLRKTLESFSPIVHVPRKQLMVIYIGTETKQKYDAILQNPDIDVMIISAIDITKIHANLLSKCIYVFNIIYKYFNESVLNICATVNLKLWDKVLFTSETFDTNTYNAKIHNKLVSLPSKQLTFRDNRRLQNKAMFYIIRDTKQNPAYVVAH